MATLTSNDGDPFEYTTHCVGTVIDGKVVRSGKFQGWILDLFSKPTYSTPLE